MIVLSDVGNEPDDSQSFVRFLVYANEFDIEGMAATTSIHQWDVIKPALIEERVEAYGRVLENLRAHADGYPDVEALRALIKRGSAAFGMAGVGAGKDTEASRQIIAAVDRPDPRPVWVLIWGGAADLAQALWTVKNTRSQEEVAAFVGKLRVYSSSDQDDAGPWARQNFPELFWIVSWETPGQSRRPTWSGISGDEYFGFNGPDPGLVSNGWLAQHIRRGPLGDLYPATIYIMEGDSPTFLYLMGNGLRVADRPDYGGWGGRYSRLSKAANVWSDAVDSVPDANGRIHTTNAATIWRWREAYQHDFAARMAWTLTPDRAGANHNPVLVVNRRPGREPLYLDARPGARVKLSAAGSTDPDGNEIAYRWWQYREAGTPEQQPLVEFSDPAAATTEFVVPALPKGGEVHIILEGKDDAPMPLYGYRRVVIRVRPSAP